MFGFHLGFHLAARAALNEAGIPATTRQTKERLWEKPSNLKMELVKIFPIFVNNYIN